MGDELRSRIADAPALSKQMGGTVPLLSRNESAQLSQSLEGMKPADRLRALSTLNTSIGDDRAFQQVLHQILPGSPVTAVVGAQLSASNPHESPVWFDHRFAQNPTDLTRILTGEQLLNPQGSEEKGSKKPFPMPQEGGSAGLREQFAQKAGDLFRSRPETGEAYFQAFKATYAALLSEKGDLSGNGNSSLQRQALQIVLGNTASINGNQVPVPAGMDPSRFAGLLDKAVATRAIQGGGGADWKDKLQGYQLREIGSYGSGRYQLVNGNVLISRPDGKGLFQVDLNSEYLPSHGAAGSPEDVIRAPPPRPQEVSLEGQNRVPKPTPEAHALKAPPVAMGGRGNGKAHPSQGPSL